MKNSDVQAYASTFASFLMRKLGDNIKDIDRIILYGSVAKGNAMKNSDVDIFIDTKKDLKKEVLEKGADLGIAYDGDGDRAGVAIEVVAEVEVTGMFPAENGVVLFH